MRNIFILGILVVGAFMAGWFTIDRDGEQTTIKINRTEIREDAKQAIDRGKEYLERQNLGAPHEEGQVNALYNTVEQAASKLRYVQQGGEYGAPAGYQPPAYQPAGAPNQLQYSYPTANQPQPAGNPSGFTPARY
ncbi:hypothetical protein CA51_20780 [Rosistilla oblonga]|uniref:Uncharacterized protein n=1 Tax=Rosistilla oblonga TaxID=2527990 RepID=A0A518ISZ6_9BACT|nr:hypothetical protein [Rosistilla oblonga]QDV12199.1 hypothetical protein CA51_20780 [Rosistilla oblonga]QDV56199.1 hypothetical protein Mal33_21800 [Rosistilla oblonga]